MTAAWLAVAQRTGRTLRGPARRRRRRRPRRIAGRREGAGARDGARAERPAEGARVRQRRDYRPLDELLDCDIVTLHTPLTYDGPDPTCRLIGGPFLSRLKPGAWLCSAGRGEVVDEAALHRALDARRLGACILDVWAHEPAIDGRLLARADIGTPHIAGYSLEGKLNGTGMVYEAACRFLGVTPSWSAEAAAPPTNVPLVTEIAGGRRDEDVLADVVTRRVSRASRRRRAQGRRRRSNPRRAAARSTISARPTRPGASSATRRSACPARRRRFSARCARCSSASTHTHRHPTSWQAIYTRSRGRAAATRAGCGITPTASP